jgi:hypothetical protein
MVSSAGNHWEGCPLAWTGLPVVPPGTASVGAGTRQTAVMPPRVVHHSMQTLRRSNDTRLTSETTMPIVKLRASTILGAFEEAQSELVGKAVVLMDGKAGTVENVWLDELHGLRISIVGHEGKWPISTIKFAQS